MGMVLREGFMGMIPRGGGGQAAARLFPGCPSATRARREQKAACLSVRQASGLWDPSPVTRTHVDRFTSCPSAS